MTTPALIEALAPGEVFVFGSNAAGHHAGGAARLAYEKFGAVWGEGEGLHGQSYAIPTMGGFEAMEDAVERFLGFSMDHPELRFLVTAIGTGIAGFPVADVARLFGGYRFYTNVEIPAEFEAVLA